MARTPALLILLFALPASAAAQPARFTIDTPAEARSACALTALSFAVVEVEQASIALLMKAPIELKRDGARLPPLLTRNFVALSNGDRLPLDADAPALLQENRLHVWPASSLPDAAGKGLSIYLPHVVLLFWSLPEGVDADVFIGNLQEERRKRDVVFLRNGDRIEGAVTALSGKTGCELATGARKLQLPWSKLAGIAFSTDRQVRLRTAKSYARAVLEGGARVNFMDLTFDKSKRRVLAKTQFGAALDFPETSLLALEVRQGPAVDLAELAPARYEHTPYLGASWPLVKDAAVTGHPLRLDGSTFEKGLGMHAASQVVYKLDQKFARFDALVGLDPALARRGRVRVAVLLDGKRVELGDAKELTSREPALIVRLDVRGVREMTLVVENGAFGDVQAHVNLAKARLIKLDP